VVNRSVVVDRTDDYSTATTSALNGEHLTRNSGIRRDVPSVKYPGSRGVRVFPVHIGLACTRGLAESARFGHDGSSPVASGQVLEREPRRCAETWSRKQNTSHVSVNAARKPNALFRWRPDRSWQTREHMPWSLDPDQRRYVAEVLPAPSNALGSLCEWAIPQEKSHDEQSRALRAIGSACTRSHESSLVRSTRKRLATRNDSKRNDRAAQLYQRARATAQRMTTRYSRREGAPLQGWAGGNEGCWATARPAAPLPRPLRATLSQNPPTDSRRVPSLGNNPRARIPAPSTTPRPEGRYSPFHSRSFVASFVRTERRCCYFALTPRHLSSYASFVLLPSLLPHHRPATFLSYRIFLSHSLFHPVSLVSDVEASWLPHCALIFHPAYVDAMEAANGNFSRYARTLDHTFERGLEISAMSGECTANTRWKFNFGLKDSLFARLSLEIHVHVPIGDTDIARSEWNCAGKVIRHVCELRSALRTAFPTSRDRIWFASVMVQYPLLIRNLHSVIRDAIAENT